MDYLLNNSALLQMNSFQQGVPDCVATNPYFYQSRLLRRTQTSVQRRWLHDREWAAGTDKWLVFIRHSQTSHW